MTYPDDYIEPNPHDIGPDDAECVGCGAVVYKGDITECECGATICDACAEEDANGNLVCSRCAELRNETEKEDSE